MPEKPKNTKKIKFNCPILPYYYSKTPILRILCCKTYNFVLLYINNVLILQCN